MKKPVKWVLRIILGIVVLVLIVLVLMFVFVNQIARQSIQRGGTYALGQNTTVSDVGLHLFSGQFGMNGLQVANPSGYKGDYLMHTGKFDLKVQAKSVLSDTVVVDSFLLDGLDVNVEKDLKTSNVQVVMDHLQKLGGQPQPAPSAQQPAQAAPAAAFARAASAAAAAGQEGEG